MTFFRSFAALALFALAACQPLEPSGGKDRLRDTGQVRLVISPESFALLDEAVSNLRVRIFQVADDRVGAQEGDDKLFPLQGTSGVYQITGIKLGWKEFEVAALNERAEVVGEGRVRHMVKPGAQRLPAIEIRLRPPTQRRRDVDLDFTVRFNAPGQEQPVSYLDVKDVLQQKCLGCHGQGSEPLDLSAFPFKSTSWPDQQAKIVTEMIKWMRDANDPMPPPPAARVPDDTIARFDRWLAAGVPANPQGSDDTAPLAHELVVAWSQAGGGESGEMRIARGNDPAHPFKGACHEMVIQGRYDFHVKVMAADGAMTHETTVQGMVIGENGPMTAVIDVPYSEPTVEVPVVVVP